MYQESFFGVLLDFIVKKRTPVANEKALTKWYNGGRISVWQLMKLHHLPSPFQKPLRTSTHEAMKNDQTEERAKGTGKAIPKSMPSSKRGM